MSSKTKNRVIAMLAASSALCLGGALALNFNARGVAARADGVSYHAFVNVGANADAALIDEALGLTEKGAQATVGGTVTSGGTLFTSYAENATYSFGELQAGAYRVAVAVLAESGTAVTIGGTAVQIPAGTTGKYVASQTVNVTAGTPLAVAVTGKLCGVLVTDENSKVLMTADYSAGQVISYGALLSDELDGATGYYSDGTTSELAIEYENITAGGGVNVNFTTIDVSGTVEGSDLSVTRYLTTMPEELVYFINCGSFTVDGKYEETADGYYGYNQTLIDYYDGALLNDAPDKAGVSKGGNDWGCYTSSTYTAPGDATFPYNTLRWTEDATDMGYMLTGLTANANYRIYIGTLSAWHARTVEITFNGNVVGAGNLRINASKGFTVYENVPADANGKIDLHMQGASTNEPCINFIAVQAAETEVDAIPSAPQGLPTVGMEDSSMKVANLTEGAKVQIYNAARPNQLLYEETVDPEKLTDDGYTLEWGEPFSGVSQFNVVQITNGGVSDALLVSVTDIEGFKITKTPENYTTGSVTIGVSAHADSGIASWSYRLGEYGAMNLFELDRPFAIEKSFTVTENGDYYVVVTSGLGVTYSEIVEVRNIDPDRPVINVTPSAQGWQAGAYHVTLGVDAVSPVTEYTLYKNGAQVATAETAPDAISFTEEGEYVVYIKTAAGRSATATVMVSAYPTTATVAKTFRNRTLRYSFTDTEHYEIASVSAYELKPTGATRMTIASGNVMDVYNAGKYVITVTTKNGTVEMFAIDVSASDLRVSSVRGGMAGGTALGIGLGVGIGGVVVAATAVGVTFFLMKKKKH